MQSSEQSAQSAQSTELPVKRSSIIYGIGTLFILGILLFAFNFNIVTIVSYFGTQGLWIILQALTKSSS